eukprot:951410-Rhodomonas_salina.2
MHNGLRSNGSGTKLATFFFFLPYLPAGPGTPPRPRLNKQASSFLGQPTQSRADRAMHTG